MEKIVRATAPSGIDFSKDWADFSSKEKNQIRDALLEMTGGRCAYTGKKIDNELAIIDHFIPLKINQSGGWNNLYVVNPITEHLKNDKYDEKLIKPDEPDYEFDRYFDIDFDTGFIIPNSRASFKDKERAEITIDILGLNHQSIVDERRAEASKFLVPSDLGNNYFTQPSGLILNLQIFSYRFYLEKARKKFKISINEYVNEIDISNYFCIESFKVENLKGKKEIYFLGENGDGKTIALQAIVLALKGLTDKFVYKYINTPGNNFSIKINDELNNKYEYNNFESYVHANVYAYGIEGRLRKHKNHANEGYLSLFNSDTYLTDPVEWFKKVDRLEAKKQIKVPLKFATIKKLFENLLENKVKIEETEEGDYFFKEKNTLLEFRQLSHGYRSVLIWLSDLLSRLAASQYKVERLEDYKGVVLVDEIGSFLHPRWEYSIVGKLRKLFPKIQWFFTTHSPIITLGASEDAVFYKLYKEDGITKVSEPFNAKAFNNRMLSSFVTSPLFNLDTARPASFKGNEYDLETGDYLYTRIHKEVKKRMENKPLQDTEIQDMISELLEEFENTGKI